MHVKQRCCCVSKLSLRSSRFRFLRAKQDKRDMPALVTKGNLRNYGRRRHGESCQKTNRFNESNNNFARASHFFVHFFPVPVQLRREMTTF